MRITEQRYQATRERMREFEEALAHVEDRATERDPLYQQVLRSNLETALHEMYEQLSEFEAQQQPPPASAVLGDGSDVPLTLLRVRIAAGLRQRDLAELLGVSEDQVRRYEATRYRNASLEELHGVATALGLRLAVLSTKPLPARAS